MKILIFTSSYLPKVNGVTRTVSTIAHGLSQRGHEVLVVTKWRRGLERESDDSGVRVVRLGRGRGFAETFYFCAAMTYFAIVARGRGDCEIVHAHGTIPGLSAFFGRLLANIPYVCTFHQDALIGWETGYRLTGMPGLKIALARLLQARICTFASYVTVQSSYVGEVTRRVLNVGKRTQIVVVPNPVNMSKFKARFVQPISEERGYLLFVGNLIKRKAVDVLLRSLPEVLRAFPDVRLIVVGRGEQEDALSLLATKLGVFSSVTFMHEVEDRVLVSMYENASVVVLPSRSEVFGNVLAEALAMHRPVVATATAGALSIITDGVSGRVVPIGDSERMANAIIESLTDRAAALERADLGYESIRSAYSVEAVSENLESLYFSLAFGTSVRGH